MYKVKTTYTDASAPKGLNPFYLTKTKRTWKDAIAEAILQQNWIVNAPWYEYIKTTITSS